MRTLAATAVVALLTFHPLTGACHAFPFPLARSIVDEAALPRPLGIGLTYHGQDQDYSLKELEFSVTMPVPEDIAIQNEVREVNVKVDLWVLPFFNVFGVLGSVNGETNIDLGPGLGQLSIDSEGTVYGGGGTVAMGVDRFFGSFTGTYTDTKLKESSSSMNSLVLSPKAGVTFDEVLFTNSVSLWAGAMYQRTDEQHSGSIEIEGVPVPVEYDVTLEDEAPWNYLAGLRAELLDHWSVDFEGGFGKRSHASGILTYRF
ncbi:hypothetical protein JW921_07755 [Candidatus Fermentibacterales bacterium]|nr:hypothetical protein [Candidatus Fermentibacterales bacterium]